VSSAHDPSLGGFTRRDAGLTSSVDRSFALLTVSFSAMSSFNRISAVLLTAAGLLLASSVRADVGDPEDALASEFKAAGDQAMQAKRYEQALAAYEHASELEPKPSLLFNRGRALQALKRYPEALAAITAFKAAAPPALAAKAGNLDELLANLRQQVSRLEVVCDVADAKVVVSGKPLGVTPLATALLVNAGSAHVSITADGYLPFERDVLLPGAGQERVVVRLVPRRSEGRITVNSLVGAVAFADGVRLGSVPAEVTLHSGRHRIRVEHAGYLPAETGVEIAAGSQQALTLPLEKSAGLLGQWWFWTGTAVIVAAGVTALVFATTERSPTSGDIPPGRVAAPLIVF